MFFNPRGNTLKAPKTPDESLPAKVAASCCICAWVMVFARFMVSSKFSSTSKPSPASSLSILSRIISSAWGLN